MLPRRSTTASSARIANSKNRPLAHDSAPCSISERGASELSTTMKTLSFLSLAAFAAMAISGCGEPEAGSADTTPAGEEKVVQQAGEAQGAATRSDTTDAP